MVEGLGYLTLMDLTSPCLLQGQTSTYNRVNTAGSQITTDTWTHLVYVYDGAWLRVYKNVSEVTIEDFPSYNLTGIKGDSTTPFIIGKSDYGAYYWDGHIDEAFYMGRGLSPAEVADIYANGLES